MSQVNTIGMILYLFLALFGGFLTGLFSRYAYAAAVLEFGKWIAVVMSIVFYVVPVWAFLSLFKNDDRDIFYGLLIVSFGYGVYFYNRFKHGEKNISREYHLPDDD